VIRAFVLSLAIAAIAVASARAGAQDPPGHDHHAAPPEPQEPARARDAEPAHDHSEMDHSEMDHGDTESMPSPLAHEIPRTAPTAAVEPWFESPEMDRARAEQRREMGGMRFSMVQAERLEWRSGEGEPVGLLEGQAWHGGDRNRLWLKTEVEALLDAPRGADALEELELQALYSRPISPFFDLQAGIRHDFEPGPSRTFAVIGVQGLAPQWFEVDLALFLSEDGDLSSRLEAEYEMPLTQRLALQFRAELGLEGSDVPELGIGSGLSTVEAGVRLSYGRVLAPYVGVEWVEKLGRTADFARAEGDEPGAVSAVFGLRFWY
jgi:copper resistance protein B